MTLGEKIKEARIAMKLTQKDVVGDYITRNMLSKIENGSATPSVKTLEYLAGALGLPAGYFISDGADVSSPGASAISKARSMFAGGNADGCLAVLAELSADNASAFADEASLMKARLLIRKAEELASAGDFRNAEDLSEKAAEANGMSSYRDDCVAARAALLKAFCRAGRGESFAEELESAASCLKYMNLEQRYTLLKAQLYINDGDYSAALEACSSVSPELESDQTRLLRLVLMGRIKLSMDDSSSALHYLTEAEKAAGDSGALAEIYALLEECYRSREDYREAYRYASLRLSFQQQPVL